MLREPAMDQAGARIEWAGVDEAIGHAEAGGAVIGAAVIAPSGERFAHNATRRFVAASTVKVPVMIALFRQIEAGRHRLDEPYTLRNADRTEGSGVLLYLHEGARFTLGDLVYLMISISDNTATNVLIDMVGMARVNEIMRELGMAGSTLERKMRGSSAAAGAAENWATPEDYARVMAALLEHRAASAASCAAMLGYLEKQQNDRRIARHLPKDHRPRWGSKTGSLAGVANDVGFVELARGMLVLSVFCEKIEAMAGEEAIGAISRAAIAAVG